MHVCTYLSIILPIYESTYLSKCMHTCVCAPCVSTYESVLVVMSMCEHYMHARVLTPAHIHFYAFFRCALRTYVCVYIHVYVYLCKYTLQCILQLRLPAKHTSKHMYTSHECGPRVPCSSQSLHFHRLVRAWFRGFSIKKRLRQYFAACLFKTGGVPVKWAIKKPKSLAFRLQSSKCCFPG